MQTRPRINNHLRRILHTHSLKLRTNLPRTPERLILIHQTTSRKIHRPGNMPSLQIHPLLTTRVTVFLTNIKKDTIKTLHIINRRHRQLPRIHLKSALLRQIPRATSMTAPLFDPRREPTIKNLNIRDTRPRQNPPGAGRHQTTTTVVDNNTVFIIQTPTFEPFLQAHRIRQRIPPQLARRRRRQRTRRITENRVGDVLASVVLEASVLGAGQPHRRQERRLDSGLHSIGEFSGTDQKAHTPQSSQVPAQGKAGGGGDRPAHRPK